MPARTGANVSAVDIEFPKVRSKRHIVMLSDSLIKDAFQLFGAPGMPEAAGN